MKKKKGFTLIEIVVSLLIASMIMVFVGSWIISSSKYLGLSSEKNENKLIGDTVLDFISERIMYAGKIKISPDNSADNYENVISYDKSTENKVLFNDEDMFGEGFYSGRSVEYYAEKKSDYLIKLSVRVSSENNYYTSEKLVEFKNSELISTPVECSQSGVIVNPIISFEKASSLEPRTSILIPGTNAYATSYWPDLSELVPNEDGTYTYTLKAGQTFVCKDGLGVDYGYLILKDITADFSSYAMKSPNDFLSYNPGYICRIQKDEIRTYDHILTPEEIAAQGLRQGQPFEYKNGETDEYYVYLGEGDYEIGNENNCYKL